ncbi:hypothetical protein [Romboutsia sp. Marseille-P6047]|uniref:hypothetical protein n=1 Tax=Romboutsia sp. Marseille-P6047 TaxID=2161817 RepID=UPI000F048DCC|nr:hypothetical protein [Romboutsia sp. Marseille-P6047]
MIYIKTATNIGKCPECGEHVDLRIFKSKMTSIAIIILLIAVSLLILIGAIYEPMIELVSVIILLASILYFKLSLILIYVLFFKLGLYIVPAFRCKKCGALIKFSKDEYENIKGTIE